MSPLHTRGSSVKPGLGGALDGVSWPVDGVPMGRDRILLPELFKSPVFPPCSNALGVSLWPQLLWTQLSSLAFVVWLVVAWTKVGGRPV